MNLPGSEEPSVEELIGALNALGVHFLAGGESGVRTAGLSPARLLATLAEQGDARLRLAVVPLLLCRPELARAVPEAISLLSEPGLTNLKLFYTAAMLLQQEYGPPLRDLIGREESLPDLFSRELGVPLSGSLETRLKRLGEHHRAASGLAANWIGSYRYAAERLIRRLTWETQWAT